MPGVHHGLHGDGKKPPRVKPVVVVNAKSIFQDGWRSERRNQSAFVAAAERTLIFIQEKRLVSGAVSIYKTFMRQHRSP